MDIDNNSCFTCEGEYNSLIIYDLPLKQVVNHLPVISDLNVIDEGKLEKIQDIVNFHCVTPADHAHALTPSKKFSKVWLSETLILPSRTVK